jgi:multiple sugar transport system permease protein
MASAATAAGGAIGAGGSGGAGRTTGTGGAGGSGGTGRIGLTARNRAATAATHALIILLGAVMLYPIIWMLISSFKPNAMIFSDTGLIPKALTLDGYRSGWKGVAGVPFGRFFLNSFMVCAICVAANIVSCSMAAYAFGRLNFFMKNIWFGVMMISIMLPAHVTTIPRFVLFNMFGWKDGYLPIIAPKLLATDAFFVFLLVQFIRGLPKDLDEAATLDGCGKIGIFARIVVPLASPALVTTALFTFLWTWDDFFNQMLYLYTPARFTVPLGLRMFVDSSGESNWGAVLAMSVLSILPSFALFFSLQQYFVQGIATTGIKG